MPNHEILSVREGKLQEQLNPVAAPYLDLEAQDFDRLSQLGVYWSIISKHRWTIATFALIVTVLAAIVSFKATLIYEATARLAIAADTPQIRSLNDLYQQIPTDDAFIGTQIQALQSDNLALRTIEQLGLAGNPAFAPSRSHRSSSPSGSPAVSMDALLGLFQGSLRVEPVRDSHVVKVSFRSTNPELAAKVANALANNFIEYNVRQKYDATRQASGWMEQQLDELKFKVEKSQQAMVDYERQNVIVNVSDKQNVIEQRLADVTRDFTNAQSERLQKESLYELAKSNTSQVGVVAQNELLVLLDGKYADLRTQYIDALGQYGPNYPKVERLRSQVNETQSQMDKERGRVVERVRNDYLAALGRERLLSGAVAKEKVEVGKLSQLMIEHNILKREFDTNQQLYDSLLQRLKDATVSAGLRATNIHVLDAARPPTEPIGPQKLRNIAVALIVGLVMGVSFAFVREALDTSVKTAEEAERLIHAAALAIIPFERALPRWWALPSSGENDKSRSESAALALLRRPSSTLGESFQSLLTSVLLSTASHPPQALLITSSRAGEGKTTTALNLAISFALRGDAVLLIDADLRRPGIGEALRLSNKKGLSSFLAGVHSLEEVLGQFTSVSNLWILPSGPPSPNPAQLLSSSAMESLVSDMRERFKFLIIDSPPILPVTDAMILSRLVDGVILVLESGATPRGAVTRARRMMEHVGARILGVVLNKVDARRDGYYGYYGYDGYYSARSDRTSQSSDSESVDLPRG